MTLFDRSPERVEPFFSPHESTRSVRVALGVSYDGTNFCGFAPQPTKRSVAGELSAALSTLLGEHAPLVCAGRTDAGVHAAGQVVHVDCDEATLIRRFSPGGVGEGVSLASLAHGISAKVAPEIACWRAIVAPEGFDARRSALSRRYRYDIDLKGAMRPWRRHDAWQVRGELDVAAMRLATDPFIGTHDFAAFCTRPDDQKDGPITRRVIAAEWHMLADGVYRFEIEANAFAHHMVRCIVGALVAVGEGKLRPSDVYGLLKSGQRSGSPAMAPAGGLCLMKVHYPEPAAEFL